MLALLQTTVDFSAIVQQTRQLIMPEVLLLLFACAALVLDVLLPRKQKQFVAWLSIAGLIISLVSLFFVYTDVLRFGGSKTGFFGMIVIDSYAVVFKTMFLIGAILSILLSIKYLEEEN
jgi:NADH-quinone oxidoreductase subunit N